MSRIIKGAISAFYGICKSIILKVLRGSRSSIGFPFLVSPSSEIILDRGGVLSIGKNSAILRYCRIIVRSKGTIKIGSHFYMNTGCIINAHESVKIGNNVEFGPGVYVFDHDHDFRASEGLRAKKYKTSPIVIGDNVWIGANSVILRGTVIGDNSVIGAGSVVNGIIPPDTVFVQKRETRLIQFSKNDDKD